MSDRETDGRAPVALGVDLERVLPLLEEEEALFEATHPRSGALYARGLQSFLYGAPMHWMQQWPGSYPVYVAEARGAHVTDVDGHTYVDFALGDTGAMFGHANPAVAEAVCDQLGRGATMMLPTEDSVWVGEALARRFGLPYWQLTTSATDANRFIIRLCRMVSGRNKVITFNCNYHGSVDETQVELDARRPDGAEDGRPPERHGPRADHPIGGVQRHRGSRRGSEPRGCRLRPHRARVDEHRHGPARRGVP